MCLELEEVVRLLKSKGIRLHRDQSEAGAEDDASQAEAVCFVFEEEETSD